MTIALIKNPRRHFFVFDKVGKDEKQYHPSKRQKEDFEYFGNNEKQDVKVKG